jgi:hypothetical protein
MCHGSCSEVGIAWGGPAGYAFRWAAQPNCIQFRADEVDTREPSVSKLIYVCCLITTALTAASLRWLCDLMAPWGIGDDLSLLSIVCCLAVTPLVALAAYACFLIWVIKASPKLDRISSQGVGLALLGTFIFFALPLLEILITPMEVPDESVLLEQKCEWVRENTLDYASEHPSRYSNTKDTWLDIDGDGDKERLERINAKTGGIGAGSAVFIYEMDEPTPRWCGAVGAADLFFVAWIRPINLDLDLAPEIWMRNASFLPWTYGFLDFSANEVRVFDPRLMILLILLPVRILPLAVWFPFRNKPIPSITIAAMTILMYVFIP